jgi:hypothetical protein
MTQPTGQDQERDGGEWHRDDLPSHGQLVASYVGFPAAEAAAILAVVAAARELRTDALEGLAADEWHRQTLPRKREFYQGLLDEIKRFDALVDALPPQAPPADPLREATEAVQRSRQREAGLDMDRIERVRRLAGGTSRTRRSPMSDDLDPAVEAAAEAMFPSRALLPYMPGKWAQLAEEDRERYRKMVRRGVAAAAPLIRAQERAAVRRELLALAGSQLSSYSASAMRLAADLVTPEATDD